MGLPNAYFHSNNQCEVKIEFDTPTFSNVIFYKGKTDYYILTLYGINNYDLNIENNVLSDLGLWK